MRVLAPRHQDTGRIVQGQDHFVGQQHPPVREGDPAVAPLGQPVTDQERHPGWIEKTRRDAIGDPEAEEERFQALLLRSQVLLTSDGERARADEVEVLMGGADVPPPPAVAVGMGAGASPRYGRPSQ